MAVTFNWIAYPTVTDGPEVTTSEWLARIGTDIYAMTQVAGYRFYRSSDFGVSWSAANGDAPHAARPTMVRSFGSVIRAASPYDGGTVEFAEFDPSVPSWGSASGIGGGLPTSASTVTTSRAAGPFEFKRSDGSRIVVYQTSATAFRVIKESGSSWSAVTTISTDTNRLMMAGMSSADNVYVFYTNGVIAGDVDLRCLVIGADDSVNGPTTVEADVEQTGEGPNGCISTGRVAFRSGQIGVVYTVDAMSDFGGSPNVHAAIGDLTSPLTPTWTAENITTYTDNTSNGANANVGASFEGGTTLKAYWIDDSGTGYNLYRSERTAPATWSAPTTMFANQGDGSWGGVGANLFGFDLLNDFPEGTVGVGILIGHFATGGPGVYVGYNGPAFTLGQGGNFASTGTFAQAGSYAAI